MSRMYTVFSFHTQENVRAFANVIPKDLQSRVIALAHQSHLGVVKTKQLLREKVYFPGIDKQVENVCQGCIPCLASTPKKTIEPLQMSNLPDAP